jgi:hypothetical protein
MTQTEYERQDPAIMRPIGSVYIERFQVWRENKRDIYVVHLNIGDFSYTTKSDNNDILYTMDSDGNPKEASVFRKPY